MTSLIGNRGMATGQGNRQGAGTGNIIPKGYGQGRLDNYTPEQHQLLSQMQQYAGPDSFLSKLGMGDQATFDQLEAPALKQFSGIQGNIASRFSGMGTGGRKSSGFQNTINQAGSDFAGQLQSNRLNLMRQAREDLFGLSNNLLNQKPYENFLVKKQNEPSFWEKFFGGASSVAGAGIGGYFGGLPGAQAGAKIGSNFGQAFLGG